MTRLRHAVVCIVAASIVALATYGMPAPSCSFPQYYFDSLTFSGNGCSSGSSNPCLANSTVSFQITGSYALQSCDTVTWNFGDGATAIGTTTSVTNAFGTGFSIGSSSLTSANGTVSLSSATTQYTEGSIIHVLVNRTNPAGPMSVNYATVDGSAHAGQDYQAASGTLSFAAGE